MTTGQSESATPYRVQCLVHGGVYLTHDEYIRQMEHPSKVWGCPAPEAAGGEGGVAILACNRSAVWDDLNYESLIGFVDTDNAPAAARMHGEPFGGGWPPEAVPALRRMGFLAFAGGGVGKSYYRPAEGFDLLDLAVWQAVYWAVGWWGPTAPWEEMG